MLPKSRRYYQTFLQRNCIFSAQSIFYLEQAILCLDYNIVESYALRLECKTSKWEKKQIQSTGYSSVLLLSVKNPKDVNWMAAQRCVAINRMLQRKFARSNNARYCVYRKREEMMGHQLISTRSQDRPSNLLARGHFASHVISGIIHGANPIKILIQNRTTPRIYSNDCDIQLKV